MSKAPKHNQPEAKKPHGRPSKFTPELADEICERLASGEPLAKICRDEHMPERVTVHEWRKGDEAFSLRYAYARDDWHDSIAHRARQTARGLGDSKQDVSRDKLIIDTDMKLLACWDRERYGTQRTEVDLTAKLPDVAKAASTLDEILGLLAAK